MNYHGTLSGSDKEDQGGNYGYPYCNAAWNTSVQNAPAGLVEGEQFSMFDNSTSNDTSCQRDFVRPSHTFRKASSFSHLQCLADTKHRAPSDTPGHAVLGGWLDGLCHLPRVDTCRPTGSGRLIWALSRVYSVQPCHRPTHSCIRQLLSVGCYHPQHRLPRHLYHKLPAARWTSPSRRPGLVLVRRHRRDLHPGEDCFNFVGSQQDNARGDWGFGGSGGRVVDFGRVYLLALETEPTAARCPYLWGQRSG